jgi:hypothetical protein
LDLKEHTGGANVEQIGRVKPELIEGYIRGKKAYEQVFPKFYELVAERVKEVLQAKYPKIEPVIGPRDKARAMAKQPHLGEKVPLDWVAFGFSGMDMYDYHIGTVLQVDSWPVKYQFGLHVIDDVWDLARSEVEAIDWKQAVGLEPTYRYCEPIREHQWVDPVRELDFASIDDEVKRIAERVSKYYEAVAAAADALCAALRGKE